MIQRLIQQTRNMLSVLRDWNAYFIFMEQRYQKHTIARLEHLDSLDLDIRGKRVLEVGAGIGEHTLFYLHRGCQVTSTDGRPELVRFIRNRLGIPAHVLDVETDIGKLTQLGKFDILHCYGLLYHISNAEAFIKHASLAADRMFLETCLTFGHENALHLIEEDRKNIWEATSGRGSLPTRSWLFEKLKEHYKYVYCPRTQPRHVEFPTNWERDASPAAHLTRAIFIASHTPIQNEKLLDHLPERYETW